jgi:hypothetical protein
MGRTEVPNQEWCGSIRDPNWCHNFFVFSPLAPRGVPCNWDASAGACKATECVAPDPSPPPPPPLFSPPPAPLEVEQAIASSARTDGKAGGDLPAFESVTESTYVAQPEPRLGDIGTESSQSDWSTTDLDAELSSMISTESKEAKQPKSHMALAFVAVCLLGACMAMGMWCSGSCSAAPKVTHANEDDDESDASDSPGPTAMNGSAFEIDDADEDESVDEDEAYEDEDSDEHDSEAGHSALPTRTSSTPLNSRGKPVKSLITPEDVSRAIKKRLSNDME